MLGLVLWVALAAERVVPETESVRVPGSAVVMVTHASTKWNLSGSAREGARQAVVTARDYRAPVVYLVDEPGAPGYYLSDLAPDLTVVSKDGNHRVELEATKVVLLGGYFNECLAATLADLAPSLPQGVQVVFVEDGIYTNRDRLLEEPLAAHGPQPWFIRESHAAFFRAERFTVELLYRGVSWGRVGGGTESITFRYLPASSLPALFEE